MDPFGLRSPDRPAPLVLGCMNFGKRTSREDSLSIVDRALDAGIRWLDTANLYNDGASERIVGEALRGRRDAAAIATKVGLARVGGRAEGLSKAAIRAACDGSLSRLGLDAIDLYYLHAPDPQTPLEETLEALGELLAAGKIRRWGVSNHASWQILELRGLAAAAGLPLPAVAQQLYNALVRQLDIEYFRFARRFSLHTTVYNPLAGGLLAGIHRGVSGEEARIPRGSRFDGNPMYRRRYWRRAAFAAVEELRAVAADEGICLLALAYAFVRRRPGVDSVLVGPGSVSHLDDAIATEGRTLSEQAARRLDEIYQELVGTDASYAR